jgi:excisionase family DNA binding protein
VELYTVDETARLLRVSSITIRRYIAAGQLEAVRVGRGVRVHREAIDRFVEPMELAASRGRSTPEEDELLTIAEQLGNIIGIGRSGETTDISQHKDEYLADAFLPPRPRKRRSHRTLGRPFTMGDPLWKIVGIGRSGGPNNVATNKHAYLAEAILSESE